VGLKLWLVSRSLNTVFSLDYFLDKAGGRDKLTEVVKMLAGKFAPP
jgi:hypothetical protein